MCLHFEIVGIILEHNSNVCQVRAQGHNWELSTDSCFNKALYKERIYLPRNISNMYTNPTGYNQIRIQNLYYQSKNILVPKPLIGMCAHPIHHRVSWCFPQSKRKYFSRCVPSVCLRHKHTSFNWGGMEEDFVSLGGNYRVSAWNGIAFG